MEASHFKELGLVLENEVMESETDRERGRRRAGKSPSVTVFCDTAAAHVGIFTIQYECVYVLKRR